ncbi:hypothetical protein ASD54_25370 [Rhizobium sp. Root149]|uniref:hypothetical protein n=1 Tax=Rhizobium sp. Root149 TaxID=1736473 RepID=UPI000715D3AA|nr:hypothetical protein [Rhizobium sp. Root149]KQZ56275.1 hypothetical protein ASD54_25370 [Rhizobium sp. Root149]
MGHDGKIIAELTAMYVRGEPTANEYEHAKLLVEKEFSEASPPPPEPKKIEKKPSKPKRKKPLWYYVIIASLVIIVSSWITEAYKEMTKSPAERAAELAQRQADEQAKVERLEREKQKALVEKAEAERVRREREVEAREREIKDRQEQKVKEAQQKAAGYHCLSAWNSSNPILIQAVKGSLRDPESFQHVSTSVMPVDPSGQHSITMQYRARNGFGGMNVGYVVGKFRNSDCHFTEIKSFSD